MCGLISIISKSYNGFTIKEKEMFDDLLYIDALRGEDSTGAMAIDTDGNLEMHKEASVAGYFQASEEYKTMCRNLVRDGAAVVGHNRKATKGNITDENAHPFVVDDRIILVHNGTLYGDHKKIADTEVDSHAIAHLIHEKGDDVEAALRELNGAYALIWYDVHAKSMNFVRNSQRPLWFCETPSAWMWASEPGMLIMTLQRHQQQLTINTKLEELPVGELHTFTRDGKQWKKEVKKLDLTTKSDATTWYGAGTDDDACAYSGIMNRSRKHWSERDEDVKPDLASEIKRNLALPAPPTPANRTLAANVGHVNKPNLVSVKVSNNERSLARKGGFSCEVGRFQEVCGKYSAGNWITGTMVDYDYVRGDTPSGGLFVYARLWDHPDILIRCYVPYEMKDAQSMQAFEMSIISAVASESKQAFKVSYKSWHAFNNGGNSKNDGDGFAVIYCTEHQPITIKVLQSEDEKDRAHG